jgi:hypothetical protein
MCMCKKLCKKRLIIDYENEGNDPRIFKQELSRLDSAFRMVREDAYSKDT